LFRQPESYEYAKCDGADYLTVWRRSRDAALEKLRARATAGPAAAEAEAAPVSPPAIPLSDILSEVMTAPGDGRARLDVLVAKFEIFRRLFGYYEPDLRRAPYSEVAGLEDYVLFGEVLAAYAERTASPMYVSTLLKLVDALCSVIGDQFSAAAAARLSHVIERERALVRYWQERVGVAP